MLARYQVLRALLRALLAKLVSTPKASVALVIIKSEELVIFHDFVTGNISVHFVSLLASV